MNGREKKSKEIANEYGEILNFIFAFISLKWPSWNLLE